MRVFAWPLLLVCVCFDVGAQERVVAYVASWSPPVTIHFAGVRVRNNGVNQPYQHFEGEHSYADLAEHFVDKNGFVRYWDTRAQAPYLWNAASRVLISYDDPQSIALEARYVMQHRLGGVMF